MPRYMGQRVPQIAVGGELAEDVFVDVRGAEEFAAGHAPDARSIPLDRLEANRFMLPMNRRLVAMSPTGERGAEATFELPIAKFFDLGGNVRISWYGDCLPTRDFPLLAEWYRQGQLDLDRVVTRVISLEEAEEGFHAMERGETLRSVIRI